MPMSAIPPRHDRLDLFALEVAAEMDTLDPDQVELAGAAERDGNVTFNGLRRGVDATASLDQVFAGRPQRAALVSQIGWAPDDFSPTTRSWVLIAVEPGSPALCAVRRIVEDHRWTHVPPASMPWTLLSTAAGLRAALEQGTPLRLKRAADPRLYRRPSEVPEPPTDHRGEL
jgi:hypothetical protein